MKTRHPFRGRSLVVGGAGRFSFHGVNAVAAWFQGHLIS